MTVLFLHVTIPPHSVYKSSHPLLVGGGTDVCHLPPAPPVAGIWNKANSPFHQSDLFTGFEAASSWTPPPPPTHTHTFWHVHHFAHWENKNKTGRSQDPALDPKLNETLSLPINYWSQTKTVLFLTFAMRLSEDMGGSFTDNHVRKLLFFLYLQTVNLINLATFWVFSF